jgi:hypothetical protein
MATLFRATKGEAAALDSLEELTFILGEALQQWWPHPVLVRLESTFPPLGRWSLPFLLLWRTCSVPTLVGSMTICDLTLTHLPPLF